MASIPTRAATDKEVLVQVARDFPFPGYVNPARGDYLDIARTVQRYLDPPASILDFGAGPCNKTAILSRLGFECCACDDLKDHWHSVADNRAKILGFAARNGIRYHVVDEEDCLPFEEGEFDMVMMTDVLEHLHGSPRELMNKTLSLVREEGYFLGTVPNAGNLMKRLRLAVGGTNLGAYDSYYWYPGKWRGHIREYVRDDLKKLADYSGLDILELRPRNYLLFAMPSALRPLWVVLTSVVKGACDSWLLVGRKRRDWLPTPELQPEELGNIIGKYTAYSYES